MGYFFLVTLEKKFGGSDMPRQARLGAAGTLHHIILRGIEKIQLFDDDLDRELPLTEIARKLGVSTSAISHILRRKLETQST